MTRHDVRSLFWNEEPRVMMAFDAKSGQQLWAKKTGLSPLTLAADDSKIYFHDGEKVVSLDQKSGDLAWESEAGHPTPVVHVQLRTAVGCSRRRRAVRRRRWQDGQPGHQKRQRTVGCELSQQRLSIAAGLDGRRRLGLARAADIGKGHGCLYRP